MVSCSSWPARVFHCIFSGSWDDGRTGSFREKSLHGKEVFITTRAPGGDKVSCSPTHIASLWFWCSFYIISHWHLFYYGFIFSFLPFVLVMTKKYNIYTIKNGTTHKHSKRNRRLWFAYKIVSWSSKPFTWSSAHNPFPIGDKIAQPVSTVAPQSYHVFDSIWGKSFVYLTAKPCLK